MSVWSCHIIKNLPWRWATSDNTPTVCSSYRKLERTAITKLKTNETNQCLDDKKHIFCFRGGKKELDQFAFILTWQDNQDLLFQKVFFSEECAYLFGCLSSWSTQDNKIWPFSNETKNQTNGKLLFETNVRMCIFKLQYLNYKPHRNKI